MQSPIELQVNGEPVHVPDGATLRDLIERLELGDRKVAVAVNRNVIPRAQFAEHRVEADDRIEILEAVGGG